MSGKPPFGQSNTAAEAQMQEAIKALYGEKCLQTNHSFPAKVNERLATAQITAEIKAAQVPMSAQADTQRLLSQSHKSKTRAQKIMWLRKAADRISAAAAPVIACKDGCSHCCHIPVSLTKPEALEIAKAIRVDIAPVVQISDQPTGYDNPCTFLVQGSCSIYEHRPIICRTHMNLDQDALLCELIPGASVPVPYLNLRPIQIAAHLLSDHASDKIKHADIRDWFPNGRNGHANASN